MWKIAHCAGWMQRSLASSEITGNTRELPLLRRKLAYEAACNYYYVMKIDMESPDVLIYVDSEAVWNGKGTYNTRQKNSTKVPLRYGTTAVG